MRIRRFLIGAGGLLALLASGPRPLWAAEPIAPEPLVHINQTFDPVKSDIRQVLPVRLKGTVYGIDPTHHGLALRDNTGFLWLKAQNWPDGLAVGEVVQVTGPVVFGGNEAVLGGSLLMQQKASEGPRQPVARVHLTAGQHAFRLDFFNATKRKAPIRVSYSGPGLPRGPVPDSVLFHSNPNAPGQFLPGLNCDRYGYDAGGRWDDFPNSDQINPVSSEVVSNFVSACATETNCVALRYAGSLAVAHEGDYEFSIGANDGVRLWLMPETPTQIAIEGKEELTAPLEIVPGQDWGDMIEPSWIQLEGTVRQTGAYGGELQLEVATEAGRMQVIVSDGNPRAAAMLLGSQVRVTGLCWSASTHQDDKVPGTLLAPSMSQVVILQAPPERWQARPPSASQSIDVQAATNGVNSLTHLRGTVIGVVPGQSLLVRDAAGQIEARTALAQNSDRGLAVELLGQPAREGTNFILQFSAVRRGPDFADPDRQLPTLTSIEQIRRLTMADASRRYPVRFKGMVTFLFYGGLQAHVQGETEGITITAPRKGALELRPGDLYEFEGVTDKGLMSPTVTCSNYSRLGRGQWPEPMRPTWRQLSNGSLEAQWVEVQGVVLSAKSLNLVLGLYGGEITVRIYDADPAELRSLLNAVVRVRGSVTLADSKKRRVENISVEVNSRYDLTVDVPAPPDVFASPAMPISSFASFDPATNNIRPARIHGQVVHSIGTTIYVMDGTNGMRVTPRWRMDLVPGDRVEVFGIPDTDGNQVSLRQAAILRMGHDPLPQPTVLAPDKPVSELADSTLVQLEGTVLNNSMGTNHVFQLQAGSTTITAEFNDDSGPLPDVPAQSRVRVTGVYRVELPPADSKNTAVSYELLLNSPADVVVLTRPSWWNWEHTLLVLAGMSVALAGAFVWITSLRRTVEERTRELRAEIEERRRIEIEVEQTHKQLVDASRRAGQAEVAANVLHNVGNVLNSVNVSANLLADRLRGMRVDSVVRAADLIQQNEKDLARFLTTDDKGRRIPQFLFQLGQNLQAVQNQLIGELGELQHNVHHINGIISTQQTYAKRFGVMDNLIVSELVENALSLQANALKQRGIAVVRDYEGVPTILSDKHTILPIIVNLVQNARQACDAGSAEYKQINVRICNGDAGVIITVTDNGVGIAPENLSRIFAHGFTTRKDGHGFGLHSGFLAAKDIGGSLSVHSDGLGRGAIFILVLPLRAPERGEATNMQIQPAADRNGNT